jgi:DUF1009 family protein
MTADTTKPIGMIAGGGQFPLLFARGVVSQGCRVVAIGHVGETLPALEEVVEHLYWVRLGQLGKIIKHFKKEDVGEAVLVGSISKTRIFRDVRPDLKGLSLWNKIDSRQDDSILRAVAAELENNGIRVVPSTLFLESLLFPKGILAGRKLSRKQKDDVAFGWRIARAIGQLDIGQCVVVRDRVVLAVEAIEGTDSTIRRSGSLARGRTVVVKVRKPNQDPRFDLPAVGIHTIETMAAAGAEVLAVEAGQTLLFDKESVVEAAGEAAITVIGVEEETDTGILSMN